jgi:hypothetical protein
LRISTGASIAQELPGLHEKLAGKTPKVALEVFSATPPAATATIGWFGVDHGQGHGLLAFHLPMLSASTAQSMNTTREVIRITFTS